MGRSTKRVALLVVPGSDLLDIAGPWEVLGHANEVLGRQAYQVELVGPGGRSATTRHGLLVGGVRALPRVAERLPDVAIMAGGSPFAPLPAGESRVVAWLRRHHEQIPMLISICTGAFVLGEAGLLDGRRVTTHWRFLRDLEARFPAATVVDEGIFVREPGLWTSAGITAGIDLS